MSDKDFFSVTEVSHLLKSMVEGAFSSIKVKGEITELKKAASGHIYFSLKDNDAVLNAICWRGAPAATVAALQEGLEIIAHGKLSTYPGRSNYQMIVQTAEAAGEGALLKLLEERKKKLAAEGLFDPSRKKPIPFLPEVIGVITSPTGAVIRDIMHRLNDRFPREVLLWPVLVQGEGAADQITTAINGFNAMPATGGMFKRPDVLIVARGGGSLEDLWAFNEENVVRAAANSEIPLISAVGHETDTTLIDYVSDLRAPTPTGAAEKAVPVLNELKVSILSFEERLIESMVRNLKERENYLFSLSKGLPNLSELIELYVQRLDDKTERLNVSFSSFFQKMSEKVLSLGRVLKASSYENVLEKGFVLVTDEKNQAITDAAKAQSQKRFVLHFKDGAVEAKPVPKQMLQGELF